MILSESLNFPSEIYTKVCHFCFQKLWGADRVFFILTENIAVRQTRPTSTRSTTAAGTTRDTVRLEERKHTETEKDTAQPEEVPEIFPELFFSNSLIFISLTRIKLNGS